MPQTDKLGRSRHRFQVGSGRYTSSDAHTGKKPTPSQQQRGIGESGLNEQWFLLSLATKRRWQGAASQILWGDFGARRSAPSGRELYNRLNRGRHLYCLSTGGVGKYGGLATLSEPPGQPVQLPDLTGLQIKAQAPSSEGPSALSWEYVQMIYYPSDGPAVDVNPAQRSGGYPCLIGSDGNHTLMPGADVANVQEVNYWNDRFYLPITQYVPLDRKYRMLTSNQIPHYDSFFGGLELGYDDTAANVFVELLWDSANSRTDGPSAEWLTFGAIAGGLRAQGGNAMPFLFADQPEPWALDYSWPRTTPSPDEGVPQYQAPPNDGLNDLKNQSPWLPSFGCEGSTIRMRVWPFDLHGWPGSKLEVRSIILPPPAYDKAPTCP